MAQRKDMSGDAEIFDFLAHARPGSPLPERGGSHALPGDGGGGTFGPMEARVAKLEAEFTTIKSDLSDVKKETSAMRELLTKIDKTLATIDSKLETRASSEVVTRIAGEIGARLVGVEGKLDAKANAIDMAAVKGAVEKLPTTWQIMGPMAALIFATLGGVAGLAFTLYKLFAPAAGH